MYHDDPEQNLIEILEMLRRDYEKAAKPYIDKLVAIRACRPSPPIVLSELTPVQAKAILDILQPTSP